MPVLRDRADGHEHSSPPQLSLSSFHLPAANSLRSKYDFGEYRMPKGVNKVILVGNLGQDPDIKYTPSGKALAKFSLATNERFKDKSGEWQDRVEWHNVLAWQGLAEIAGEYLSKGSRVYIEGKLQTSSWEDRQHGEKKYRTEVVARELVLLGGGNGNASNDSVEQDRPAQAGFGQRSHEQMESEQTGEIDDSDIPF